MWYVLYVGFMLYQMYVWLQLEFVVKNILHVDLSEPQYIYLFLKML